MRCSDRNTFSFPSEYIFIHTIFWLIFYMLVEFPGLMLYAQHQVCNTDHQAVIRHWFHSNSMLNRSITKLRFVSRHFQSAFSVNTRTHSTMNSNKWFVFTLFSLWINSFVIRTLTCTVEILKIIKNFIQKSFTLTEAYTNILWCLSLSFLLFLSFCDSLWFVFIYTLDYMHERKNPLFLCSSVISKFFITC